MIALSAAAAAAAADAYLSVSPGGLAGGGAGFMGAGVAVFVTFAKGVCIVVSTGCVVLKVLEGLLFARLAFSVVLADFCFVILLLSGGSLFSSATDGASCDDTRSISFGAPHAASSASRLKSS